MWILLVLCVLTEIKKIFSCQASKCTRILTDVPIFISYSLVTSFIFYSSHCHVIWLFYYHCVPECMSFIPYCRSLICVSAAQFFWNWEVGNMIRHVAATDVKTPPPCSNILFALLPLTRYIHTPSLWRFTEYHRQSMLFPIFSCLSAF